MSSDAIWTTGSSHSATRNDAVDYGRNLAPDPRRSKYPIVYSIEGSPTGELIAAVAYNRKDDEFDIVLLSAATGDVVDSVTEGFNQSMGFEYIPLPGQRFNTVSWISWEPQGDRIAYFVRKGKYKSLIVQNIVTKRIERRIELNMVDAPESPDFAPDGKSVIFSALTNAVGDIYQLDLESEEVTNLTQDNLAAYAPLYAPTDAQSSIWLGSRATTSTLGWTWRAASGRSSRSGPMTMPVGSSWTTGRWYSPPPRSIRLCRLTPTSPETARSSTSGRSTWKTASCDS